MGFRFRKSIGFGPFRTTLSASKRGLTLGGSAGAPGARVSVNSRGQRRTTLGIPGSGFSWVSTTSRRPLGRTVIWSLIVIAVLLGALTFCAPRESLGAPRLVTGSAGRPPVSQGADAPARAHPVPVQTHSADLSARRCDDVDCVSPAVRDQYEHPGWSTRRVRATGPKRYT